MKTKTLNKIFKYIFIVFFITFLALYVSQSTGYFEFQNKQKATLAKNQIKKFEEDVKKGKNIDIDNYVTPPKNYDNTIAKAGLKVSETAEKYVQKIITGSFKLFSKLLGE